MDALSLKFDLIVIFACEFKLVLCSLGTLDAAICDSNFQFTLSDTSLAQNVNWS